MDLGMLLGSSRKESLMKRFGSRSVLTRVQTVRKSYKQTTKDRVRR